MKNNNDQIEKMQVIIKKVNEKIKNKEKNPIFEIEDKML